ncbi:MAG: CvpA family protein [Candidatus Omnitrophota bacterium]|jgi:uncharacterized membrane protein required for colicin V production
MAIIKGFGFIDIILLSLCVLITYEAIAKGFFSEILKAVGLFCGAIFSFQLYPYLAANVTEKLPFLAKEYSKFSAFCLLFFSIIFVFGILSKIFNSFFKREKISSLEKVPAILVGLVRIIFLSSIIVFLLYLFPVKNDFIARGLSKEFLKNIAPKVYLVSIKSYNKIQPNFKVNEEVEKLYETKSDISGNSKKGN